MPDHDVMIKRQQVLADFGDFAIRSQDLDTVLTEACRLAGEALGTNRAKILEVQKGRNELLLRAGVGWRPGIIGTLRLPMNEHSSETFSVRAREPVITRNIADEDRFDMPDFLKEAGIVAFVNVPILVPGGRLYGILQVDSIEPREFGSDDTQFLRTYATILGPVIDRLQLAIERHAVEEQRSADIGAMEELQRVSTELMGGHETQWLYRCIVEAAVLLMRSDAAGIQVLDAGSNRLKLLAWQGLDPETVAYWEWVSADGDSVCGRVLGSGERTVVPDVERFDVGDGDLAAYRRSGIRAVQSTPLRAISGRIVGVLSTHWRDPRKVETAEYRYLDVLARLSADLIERLHANEQLRDSEERLRQFGEASQDVLWIRDAETLQWRYLTPGFEAIYGLSRQEALADDNYRSWLDLIVPEDRPIAEAAVRRVRRGERVAFDYRIRRPADGAIRWLRDTDFPINDASGTITAFGGVGHDLTELRETELRLRALVDGIPQLVWRAVDGGRWTWASPQWTAYTGQSEADSHGSGWLDPLHPDDREVARQAWATARATGGFKVEYRIRHADSQSYRWFTTSATPLRDETGSVIEWLGTSTDIDELRKLQARQQVLVSELQHRTFNLMGMVRSMADATVRSSRDLQDFKPKFRDRVDALARVQRLLSRLKEGERVLFDDLIRSELAAVGALGDGDDRVSLDGPPGVTLRSGTVQAFAMALHELTTNAVKYGALNQPGGHLHVGWRLDRDPGDDTPWLHVEWHETGVVMPPVGARLPGTGLHSTGPHSTGQGRALIEQALPYQLQARTTYVMASDGVKCSISLPVAEHE